MKSANEIIEELVKSESSAAAVAFLGSDGMRQLLDARADDALEAAAELVICSLHSEKYFGMGKLPYLDELVREIRAMKGGGK